MRLFCCGRIFSFPSFSRVCQVGYGEGINRPKQVGEVKCDSTYLYVHVYAMLQILPSRADLLGHDPMGTFPEISRREDHKSGLTVWEQSAYIKPDRA